MGLRIDRETFLSVLLLLELVDSIQSSERPPLRRRSFSFRLPKLPETASYLGKGKQLLLYRMLHISQIQALTILKNHPPLTEWASLFPLIRGAWLWPPEAFTKQSRWKQIESIGFFHTSPAEDPE